MHQVSRSIRAIVHGGPDEAQVATSTPTFLVTFHLKAVRAVAIVRYRLRIARRARTRP